MLAALGLTGASDADLAVAGLMEVRGLSPAAAAAAAADAEVDTGLTAALADRFAAVDDRLLKPLFGGRPSAGFRSSAGGGAGGACVPLVAPGSGDYAPPPGVGGV